MEVSKVRCAAVYSNLSMDDIATALRSHFPEREIRIAALESDEALTTPSEVVVTALDCSADDKASAEILKKKLESKEKDLKNSEESSAKAIYTIQTLHKQQQALYDEFVLLRQRYDEQKSTLVNILWTHCAKFHPDLRQVPDSKDKDFVENNTQLGDDILVGNALGEGQFATVRVCSFRKQKDKEYALKIIKKDRIISLTSLMRVSNEIENLKLLQSPFVVAVEAVIHTTSNLYIITEKGGLDLFEFFDEHPDGVPEKWAKQIMVSILKGVLYCHEQGICHRDLKPENILVTFDSINEVCTDLKLCDFGLSTKFKHKEKLTDFCGSPGFFAPEMIINGSYYGDKVDVWSIGCILLELLLGHEKFCDAWMTSYDYEILQNKAKFTLSISDTLDDLPLVLNFSRELNEFVLQFLQLNPTSRPTLSNIARNAWLGGALEDDLAVLRASKLSLNTSIDTMDMHRTTSFSNLMEYQNLQAGGSIGTSSKGGFGDRSMDNVDTDLLKAAFNSLSDKERRHMEEYILHHAIGGESPHRHQMHLPPIEPATPSIHGAKRILQKGEELEKAASASAIGGRFFGTVGTPPKPNRFTCSACTSPMTVGLPLNSTNLKRLDKSPLPGLSEERFTDDGPSTKLEKEFSQQTISTRTNKSADDIHDIKDTEDNGAKSRTNSINLSSSSGDGEGFGRPPLLSSRTERSLRDMFKDVIDEK